MNILFTVFILLAALTSFGAAPVSRKNDDDLSRTFAEFRKSQVKTISYVLYFELEKKIATFKAKATLNIELNHTQAALSLDVLDQKISSLTVNGILVKKYPTRKGSLDIPAKYLQPKTQIEIVYTGEFSKNAGGFIKSIDPEDGAEYLYTDFEPYQAHTLFPCLDQPDLKASFQVSVKAPKDWKVIQNELIDTQTIQEDSLFTTFKPTPLISTYLFFLGAGPFVEWTDKAGKIPLSLYARKTLAKYVDAESIFKTTKAGLSFFNDYFQSPYPFSKYAQLFIPEFAWGGMENPGAVTLNEKNIFRGPVSISKYENRDNLILHEMAHMWFGDLVTMQWWNDLWLNESFATYLASIAQDRTLKGKGTWISFFSTKAWGYWQDQLITTHPIETEVPDVRTAKGNFDGITYAKGASAMKQLHFFVGEDGFRDGLRYYFKTYAFKNTQRKDFIEAIAMASKKDLNDWTNKWLKTAGPNAVSVDFTCEEGKIKTFSLNQLASVSKTFSPHRLILGFYNIHKNKLKETETDEVVYASESTIVDNVIGDACPDFVFPNLNDQDYALFSLDQKSLTQTKLALTTLPDSLSRSMLWFVLSEMVRNQKLKPLEFFDLAIQGLMVEEDDLLLGNLLGRQSILRDQYFLYLTSKQRAELAEKFELVLYERILKAKPASSLQMNFFDFYVSIVQTPSGVKRIQDFLANNTQPKGIVLDQDRRWALLSSLATNGVPGIDKIIQDELKRDPSTLGKRMSFAVTSAIPEIKNKKTYWKTFFGKEKLAFSSFKEAATRFHGPNQEMISLEFGRDFFTQALKTDWKKHDDDVEVYFEELFPTVLCNEDILKQSKKALKKARNLTSLAKRAWLEAQDELQRCVMVRSKHH